MSWALAHLRATQWRELDTAHRWPRWPQLTAGRRSRVAN